jgi:hypothetical protein
MDSVETRSVLTCRVPHALKVRIGEFRKKYHLRTESEGIIELLQIGLFVDSRRDDLEDPEVVKHLRDNLYNERLVDWIYELPDDRLDALFGAFRSAKELRFQNKLRNAR